LAVALAAGGLFVVAASQAFHTSVADAAMIEVDTALQPIGGKVGACIVPGNGYCAEVTELVCLLINGDFQGPGTTCPPEPKDDQPSDLAPQPVGGKVGACIVPGNGYCAEVTELVCLLINGDYQGPGTSCPPEPKHD